MAVSGLAAAGVYLIACIAAGRTMPDLLVPVRLLWNGKSAEVTALIDTGNHLTEPLTGRPVSIIAGEIAEKLMEERQIQQQGCFLIPYHSIGVEKGYLQGVTIDRMEIGKQGTITTINKPVLAIYKGKISAEGQYEMILHPLHAALENRK
jgi:sigma-E processing peptidase SpoIIGA